MKAAELKQKLHKAIDAMDEDLIVSRYNELMALRLREKTSSPVANEAILTLLDDLLELHQNLTAGSEDAPHREENMTMPGPPMTEDELRERILSARERVKNGGYIAHDDLKREAESW